MDLGDTTWRELGALRCGLRGRGGRGRAGAELGSDTDLRGRVRRQTGPGAGQGVAGAAGGLNPRPARAAGRAGRGAVIATRPLGGGACGQPGSVEGSPGGPWCRCPSASSVLTEGLAALGPHCGPRPAGAGGWRDSNFLSPGDRKGLGPKPRPLAPKPSHPWGRLEEEVAFPRSSKKPVGTRSRRARAQRALPARALPAGRWGSQAGLI